MTVSRKESKLVGFPQRSSARVVEHEKLEGAGRFGMLLFLLALSILFAASLIGIIIVRFQVGTWRPEGFPGLPGGLWVSTALILGASVSVHLSVLKARAGDRVAMVRALGVTFVIGLVFLMLQGLNWWEFVKDAEVARGTLFGFSFYVLTGLHALHVLGGLIQTATMIVSARRGRYGPENHGPIEYGAMYWHFLDVVWLILYAALVVLL